MPTRLVATFVLAALALAACGRGDRPKTTPANPPASSGSTAAPSQPQASTQTTPANTGQPQSMAEKREGANPQQQQVDPKEAAQHRDFQQSGDSAGPKSEETTPGPGTGK